MAVTQVASKEYVDASKVYLGMYNGAVPDSMDITSSFTWNGGTNPARSISFFDGLRVPKVGDVAVWENSYGARTLCKCTALPGTYDSTWSFMAYMSTYNNRLNKINLDIWTINPGSSQEGEYGIQSGSELPVSKGREKFTLFFMGYFNCTNSGGTAVNMYPMVKELYFGEDEDFGFIWLSTGDYSPSSGDFTPEARQLRVQLLRDATETHITGFRFSIESMGYINFNIGSYSQDQIKLGYTKREV